jgi:lysozyme
MPLLPTTRPEATRLEVSTKLAAMGIDENRYHVHLLGVRGYNLDAMGERGHNDRSMYDDAMFLITSTGFFRTFNANVDPSAYRNGVANLCPGTWLYKLGIHGITRPKFLQYEALVQAAEVEIVRDGSSAREKGWFGINIHRGGNFTTSSLGCQTIPPGQWNEFISTVKSQLDFHDQTILPYVLIERQGEARI